MFRLFISLLAGALLLSACAQIPRQELNAYATAYDQAEAAGDQLLDVFAPYFPPDLVDEAAAPAADKDACDDFSIDRVSGLRKCFDPRAALGQDAERIDEPVFGQVRRAALQIIGDYNRLLLGLASGQSADALTGRIDRGLGMVNSISSLGAPLQGAQVAALFELLTPIAAKIETYRASNAAARSVVDAQPDVSALIRFMIADTNTLYALYSQRRRDEFRSLRLDRADAEDDENADEVARIAAAQDAITAEGAAVEDALSAYVKLLDRSDAALIELATSIRDFQSNPAARVNALVRTTTEARLLSTEFVNQIRTLQSVRN